MSQDTNITVTHINLVQYLGTEYPYPDTGWGGISNLQATRVTSWTPKCQGVVCRPQGVGVICWPALDKRDQLIRVIRVIKVNISIRGDIQCFIPVR